MFTKKIKYEDYNGVEREETLYFNLNKSELSQMNFEANGSLSERLQATIDRKDAKEIMRFIKSVLLMSYGEKSEDGRYFMKNDAIRERFECSEPFNIFYMDLCSDTQLAVDFIKGILPADLAKEAAARLEK